MEISIVAKNNLQKRTIDINKYLMEACHPDSGIID